MSAAFLTGMVSAWALTQVGLGVYFMLAYVVGRREREFFLFSLLCLSFSIASVGIALDYVTSGPDARAFSDLVTYAGLILASAFNVHFALEFAKVERRRQIAIVLYVLVTLFEVLLFAGTFFSDYRLIEVELFGSIVAHGVGQPTIVGQLFHLLGLIQAGAAIVLLVRAYRAGRREALSALVGVMLCVPAIGNDVAMVVGGFKSLSLLPHAFLMYAFGVAGTLLLRYRVASGELEHTATSL
ncbi:MAG TPA: 7TM diverse intracellular signaling domain-containing protein, partial [Polyangiaceae bacterium]|nr:7TM diverse intracellular signaling domain-containing protein [Polyangiaceae bacterium]